MKHWILFLSVMLFMLFAVNTNYVYAAESDNYYTNWDDLVESLDYAESASGSALVANALYLTNQDIHDDLQDIQLQLEYIVALLLILVVFEILRIVRSWSKGVGLK